MSIIATIEADIVGAWGEVEAIVEDDAKIAWAAIKTMWLSLAPKEWVIIQGLVTKAVADVESGDYGDIVTSLLNQAEADGAGFVLNLTSETLTAIVGVFKATPKPAA